ncbi:MAG: TonB-dependent receptor, partial [Acidobacteria bacterium]
MRWTRPARTGLAASLLAAALAVAGPALGDEEAPRGGAGAPKEETVELDEAAASVTGALQGKEAVRIQTLCTHCNSANIQVGGLAAELVPMELGGFPLLGGMAVAYALNCLPPDTVAEAQVVKGPGSADLPNPAAGGTISLEPSEPSELPYLTAGVLAGTYRRRSAVVRLAGEAAPWLSGQVLAGTDRADPVDDDGDGFNDVGRLDREFAELRAHIAAAERHELELGA